MNKRYINEASNHQVLLRLNQIHHCILLCMSKSAKNPLTSEQSLSLDTDFRSSTVAC